MAVAIGQMYIRCPPHMGGCEYAAQVGMVARCCWCTRCCWTAGSTTGYCHCSSEHWFRCVVPDLPLGARAEPMVPDADLSPRGLADLLAEVLVELGLDPIPAHGLSPQPGGSSDTHRLRRLRGLPAGELEALAGAVS
jgi:hypothetical protein